MFVVFFLLGCSSGPCSELGKVTSALGQVPDHLRTQLVAQGLAEQCELPPPVREGLLGVAQGMPGMTRMVDLRVASEAPELWAAACPGGPAALASSMQLRDADARRALHTDCALGRHGWSADGFARARGPVVLPIVLAELLKSESAMNRSLLLDALAGF